MSSFTCAARARADGASLRLGADLSISATSDSRPCCKSDNLGFPKKPFAFKQIAWCLALAWPLLSD